jgi:hypothetical protein
MSYRDYDLLMLASLVGVIIALIGICVCLILLYRSKNEKMHLEITILKFIKDSGAIEVRMSKTSGAEGRD